MKDVLIVTVSPRIGLFVPPSACKESAESYFQLSDFGLCWKHSFPNLAACERLNFKSHKLMQKSKRSLTLALFKAIKDQRINDFVHLFKCFLTSYPDKAASDSQVHLIINFLDNLLELRELFKNIFCQFLEITQERLSLP